MTRHERHHQIVNVVNKFGEIGVEKLSELFSVSVETMRRDLGWLEGVGRVIRTHGGARSIQGEDVAALFAKRRNEKIEPKRIMAEKALEMIKPNMTIALDASSSDWYLAKLLPDIPLKVVTNSIEIIKELTLKNNIEIICVGGIYSRYHSDFLGEMTQKNLRSIHINISFISCFGVNIFTGLWENTELNALTKRTMIEVSDKSVLLADTSKYGRRSLYNLADWSLVKYVVNDELMDEDIIHRLTSVGVKVI